MRLFIVITFSKAPVQRCKGIHSSIHYLNPKWWRELQVQEEARIKAVLFKLATWNCYKYVGSKNIFYILV